MKIIAVLTLLLTAAFSSFADYSLEDISPHISANAQIVWQASINHLPKSFWIYKKVPRIFSSATISNAIVLASFQDKGFPKPSNHRITLWATEFGGEPSPPYLTILPDLGQVSYSLGDRAPDIASAIYHDAGAIETAWDCLAKLNIDLSQFVKTNAAASGTWGVFFPRTIDEIQVYAEYEGFSFQQIGTGKIRSFSLSFPNLERDKNRPTITPVQIIACIRALKTPLLPKEDEPDYFGRMKYLGSARKLTITKITPYYGEGIFGEAPNDETSKIVMPVAELEAIADFGTNNVIVQLLAPLISTEADRLLKHERAPRTRKP